MSQIMFKDWKHLWKYFEGMLKKHVEYERHGINHK